MNRTPFQILTPLIITFYLFTLTGCLEAISAFGTGAIMTAEYVLTGGESKTISHEFGRAKRALLVALCKMKISVDEAREIEGGEEVIAKADELEIRVELKQITSTVTRITVRAQKDLLHRDRATAKEIVQQTTKVAEKLAARGVKERSAQL